MSDSEIENRQKFSAEQKKQADLKLKIEETLIPLVGPGNYTVQVNVDMDFSKREQTRRSYNNDLPAVRSERTVDDFQTQSAVQGVPGALSNQPPTDAQAPQTIPEGGAGETTNEASGNRRLETERNYDLDTTISYTQQQMGALQRVTVAISLDYIDNPEYKPPVESPAEPAEAEAGEGAAEAEAEAAAEQTGEQQAAEQQAAAEAQQAAVEAAPPPVPIKIPRPQEEIDNIRRLVQGVIGFSLQRGDSVEVISFPFAPLEVIAEPPPAAFYEMPWFEKLLKPAVMLFGLMFLIFGLLRPIMKRLATPAIEEGQLKVADEVEADAIKIDVPEPTPDEVTISHDFEALGLPEPAIESAAHIKQAQSIAMDNSTLVAQVVRNWIDEDG